MKKSYTNFFIPKYIVAEVLVALILLTITIVRLLLQEFSNACCPPIWVIIMTGLLFLSYLAIPLFLTYISAIIVFGNVTKKQNYLLFIQIVGMFVISVLSILYIRSKIGLLPASNLSVSDIIFLIYAVFTLLRIMFFIYVLIKNRDEIKELSLSTEEVFDEVPKAQLANTNKYIVLIVIILCVIIYFKDLDNHIFISLGESCFIGSFILGLLSMFPNHAPKIET